MLTTINLLPWREEQRQQKRKEFGILFFVMAAGAVLIIVLIHMMMSSKVDHQLTRNKFLSTEIARLDDQIAGIRDLKKLRRSLVERMEVIQDLQRSRPSIVHLFTEIVSTVPDGIFLKSLTQTENDLRMTGQAESNARVSTYMRNLDNSEWLKDPNLTIIETLDSKTNRVSTFALKVKLTSPEENEDEITN